MRNATSFRAGSTVGRRKGGRNKVKREVRALMVRLEKADDGLDPSRWFRRLQEIALGADLPAAVSASRVLLEYRFGKPLSSIDLDVEHSVEPSVMELLEQIAVSDRHRKALEERERRQLREASITIEPEKEPS